MGVATPKEKQLLEIIERQAAQLAALSGAAIGAAAGGLTGGLIGCGIPEYEAKLYSDRLAKGRILVGVHAVDSKAADAAVKAFQAAHTHDIKKTLEVVAK